jgi:GTP-binding protein
LTRAKSTPFSSTTRPLAAERAPRLKRIYILFNGKHGLNEADKTMLAALSARVASHGGARHTLQAVITKIDSVPLHDVRAAIRRIRRDVFAAAPLCLPPLVTSARDHPFVGVDELRASIIGACGVARAVPGA